MVKIYCSRLPDEESFDGYFELFKNLLPEDVFQAASKFRFIQGVQRKILGDALMRMAVWLNFRIRPDEMIVAVGSAGKPYLQSHPNIHFNISHSGHWVVVAVSDYEVGIDVERVKKVNLGIAERFYSEKEKQQLFALAENLQMDFFFDLWTMKESFLKAIGKGLTQPLKSFTILKNQEVFLISEYEKNPSFTLKQFYLENGYKLAVCTCGDIVDEQLSIVELPFIAETLKTIQNYL